MYHRALTAIAVASTQLLTADFQVAVASNESISSVGINSVAVPYTGMGVGIGQVETSRPGDPDLDNASNSNFFTNPAGVFLLDNRIAPTANAQDELTNMTNVGPHATEVAGVMISNDVFTRGVSGDADLFSSSGQFRVTTPPIDAVYTRPLSAQFIATQNGGDIRAINMSFTAIFDTGGVPDGNSLLTQFVDWSASVHDTLYVVAGAEGALPANFGQPQDNFNGMTVAASSKLGGVFRQAASFNDYSINADTIGDRTTIDIIAPGTDIELVDLGGGQPTVRSGTSFAAPHVTGTVALIQEFGDQQPPAFGTNYMRHEVNKAVIMNSADKLIDNGTVLYKGNAIPQGNLLGMERTVVKTDGTSNWLDSFAFDNFDTSSPEPLSGGFFTLDEQIGAGHLNAKRALQQFIPGEQEPDGADVPLIGWDYGTMSGNSDINKYALDTQLSEGEFISITLAWDREVNFATGGGDGTFDEGDTFEDYTNTDPDFDIIANDVISDLDLYLMPAGSFNINQHVAVSAGIDSTLEHIFFPIPATGDYEIWVDQVDDDAGNPDYGLAWWAGLAPDIPVPNPVSDFDGDGDVDAADLAQWQGDYGVNSDSDADGDGDSDGSDFLAWQREFTGAGSVADAPAVPEPSGLLLAVMGLPICWTRRRKLAG